MIKRLQPVTFTLDAKGQRSRVISIAHIISSIHTNLCEFDQSISGTASRYYLGGINYVCYDNQESPKTFDLYPACYNKERSLILEVK